MFPRLALLVAALAAPDAEGGPRRLKVVPSKALPAIEAVSVYPAGTVKPGKDRPKPVLTITTFADAVELPVGGPFDVYAKPKGGVEVLAAAKLAGRAGRTHELKLGDALGVVEVFQGDGPKADKVVVTAPDDPGPDEKGHAAVQVGADYRVELAVPEGFYAVWVVPANGARAQRVADRIRVLPGRVARVGE